MSENFWLALIGGLPAAITAFAGLVVALRTKTKQEEMHKENTAAITQSQQAVRKLDDHLNGQLDRIVASAVRAALADERLAVATQKDPPEKK